MAANGATGIGIGELAGEREVRECLQWFTREKQWINETHLQLCRIPAPTFLEQERAAWFLEQFPRLGMGCLHRPRRQRDRRAGRRPVCGADRAPGYRDRRRARRTISRWTRTAGFAAPASPTTAPAWPPCWPSRAPGRMARLPADLSAQPAAGGQRGRGRRRQSAGHALPVQAIAAGTRSWRSWWLDGANTDHITSRALGSRRFEVAFTGPGGHSWSDYGVGNPVHALCRAVALFAETRDRRRAQIGHQCRHDRRRLERERHRRRRRAPKWTSARKATRRWTNWLDALGAGGGPRPGDREPARHRRQGDRQAQGDRLAAGGGAARRRPHPPVHAGCGRAPRYPLPSGLRFHRRQYSPVAGHPGHRHRRGRSRRRRAHHRRNGSGRKGATWASSASFCPCCCCCAIPTAASRGARPVNRRARRLKRRWSATHGLGRHVRAGEIGAGATFRPLLFLALRFSLATGALLVLFRVGRMRLPSVTLEGGGRGGACAASFSFPVIYSRRSGCGSPPRPDRHSSPGLTRCWYLCSRRSSIGSGPRFPRCWGAGGHRRAGADDA